MEKQITVTLDVEAITREAIEAQVHRMVFEENDQAAAILGKSLSRKAEELVASVAQEEVRRRITVAIDEVFTNGWQKTDEYGRDQGKPINVRDLVLGYLTAKDTYSSRGQWMEETTRRLFSEVFQKEIAPMVEQAKKTFREMLDTAIRDKLALALREAMGLK